MRHIGLHLRTQDSFAEVAKKAKKLNLKIFQNFLVNTLTGKYLKLEPKDQKEFLKLRKNFDQLYLHSSFWINLCGKKEYSYRLLKHEMHEAERLEYNYIILHPGSYKDFDKKIEGIDLLAKRLNKLLKEEKDNSVKLVLENTAHGKKTIGSKLKDFQLIQEKLDCEVFFCLDTAHAYAQGYDLKNEQQLFLNDVNEFIGFNKVVLIHLNDSKEKLNSKKDLHAAPGEGLIGLEPLKKFIEISELKKINVILELPPSFDEAREKEVLNLFK